LFKFYNPSQFELIGICYGKKKSRGHIFNNTHEVVIIVREVHWCEPELGCLRVFFLTYNFVVLSKIYYMYVFRV